MTTLSDGIQIPAQWQAQARAAVEVWMRKRKLAATWLGDQVIVMGPFGQIRVRPGQHLYRCREGKLYAVDALH